MFKTPQKIIRKQDIIVETKRKIIDKLKESIITYKVKSIIERTAQTKMLRINKIKIKLIRDRELT